MVILRNRDQSIAFSEVDGGGFRPEWIRLGDRQMLRFKDHEFLNIGAVRVTVGELREASATALRFGGTETFAETPVDWELTVDLPADGGSGFRIATRVQPQAEPIELLEALTCYETPADYDGTERQTTVMPQQPVYRFEGDRELSGAGYTHPFWYYGRAGRAHLTVPTQTPVMCCHLEAADGANRRCLTFLANWAVCSVHDLFAQPSRPNAEGLRGRKFLIGALNWNASLHKDPNVLVEPTAPLRQELIVDVADALPGGRLDTWLAAAWERSARQHLPADGAMPAFDVATAQGASWIAAAQWLSDQLGNPAGCPGFVYPGNGTCVYAPNTRPKWDGGVPFFAAQWVGPLAQLGRAWGLPDTGVTIRRLVDQVLLDQGHSAEKLWTIGPTPFHVAILRGLSSGEVSEAMCERTRDYLRRRADRLLRPPAGEVGGDAGMHAWEAYANLLAAAHFEGPEYADRARLFLAKVVATLDDRWESFNCAAEGDAVGCGQGRPFGHGIAATAACLAAERFAEPAWLDVAERCAHITLGLYYATANLSPTPDMDTRGWAVGANGGRDQLCHMPPWETAHALQQFAHLILAGRPRDGYFDLLWTFARTGLCMFPAARTHKRVYTPDFQPVYRPIDSLASERAFYRSLPYLAYEEPWDQTMLAGYQGVEPIVLALYLGGGLVAATDSRILALVPEAAVYRPDLHERFTVYLWTPLAEPVETSLVATVAQRQDRPWQCLDTAETLTPEAATTRPIRVPSRQALQVRFERC